MARAIRPAVSVTVRRTSCRPLRSTVGSSRPSTPSLTGAVPEAKRAHSASPWRRRSSCQLARLSLVAVPTTSAGTAIRAAGGRCREPRRRREAARSRRQHGDHHVVVAAERPVVRAQPEHVRPRVAEPRRGGRRGRVVERDRRRAAHDAPADAEGAADREAVVLRRSLESHRARRQRGRPVGARLDDGGRVHEADVDGDRALGRELRRRSRRGGRRTRPRPRTSRPSRPSPARRGRPERVPRPGPTAGVTAEPAGRPSSATAPRRTARREGIDCAGPASTRGGSFAGFAWTVTSSLAVSAPSVAVRRRAYEPGAEKVTTVTGAAGSAKRATPGPDTRLHAALGAPSRGLPSSLTDPASAATRETDARVETRHPPPGPGSRPRARPSRRRSTSRAPSVAVRRRT